MRGRARAAMLAGLAVTLLPGYAAAELPGDDADGWYAWRVPVVDSAPELCCYDWSRGIATRDRCNLDGRGGGFATSRDERYPSDEIRVFAFLEAGKTRKIRALGAQCPVTSDSPISDLGAIPADASIGWLRDRFSSRDDIGEDAIAAVALHAGDAARRLLVRTARADPDENNREAAVFWMGQARIDETAGDLRDLMFADRNPEIRRQAAFSYAQSTAADRGELLVRQGRRDADAEVRSQAWFWLAQIAAPESEREIIAALAAERDGKVREEAVFALSQLPEERAVRALASILEDRRMDMALREEALFWLAQSDSDAAFDYVERLLTGN